MVPPAALRGPHFIESTVLTMGVVSGSLGAAEGKEMTLFPVLVLINNEALGTGSTETVGAFAVDGYSERAVRSVGSGAVCVWPRLGTPDGGMESCIVEGFS